MFENKPVSRTRDVLRCRGVSITSVWLKPSPLRMWRRCAFMQDGVKRPFGCLKASRRHELGLISMKCICMFVVLGQRKTLLEKAASSFSCSCVNHEAGSANQANFCTRDVSTVNRSIFFHLLLIASHQRRFTRRARIMTLVDKRVGKPVRFLTVCDFE